MTQLPDTTTPPPCTHVDDDGEDREASLLVTSVDVDGIYRSTRTVIPLGDAEDAEDPDAFATELLAAAYGLAAQRGSRYLWAFSGAVAEAQAGSR